MRNYKHPRYHTHTHMQVVNMLHLFEYIIDKPALELTPGHLCFSDACIYKGMLNVFV